METIELSGSILTNNPDFVYALNRGEEYVLIDTNGNTSLVDPSNTLTNALTGGIYFEDATTNDVHIINGSGNGQSVIIDVICTKLVDTDSYGLVNPVLKLTVGSDRTNVQGTFTEGDVLVIINNYQTITKIVTFEDAILLNRE